MQQRFLIEFINENFVPIKNINFQHTDYGLKQKFSRLHFFVTQQQFYEAMLIAGFKSKEKVKGYMSFNISQKSRYFSL